MLRSCMMAPCRGFSSVRAWSVMAPWFHVGTALTNGGRLQLQVSTPTRECARRPLPQRCRHFGLLGGRVHAEDLVELFVRDRVHEAALESGAARLVAHRRFR